MADDLLRVRMDGLDTFARDMKAAPKELRRELYRGLNSVTKELRNEHLRTSALEKLPARGGLGRRVAMSSITARIRVQSTFGVKLQVKERKGQPFAAGLLDLGENRHPTFGHKPTRKQDVTPRWFAEPWEKFGDDARKAMLDVVDRVKAKLRAGG